MFKKFTFHWIWLVINVIYEIILFKYDHLFSEVQKYNLTLLGGGMAVISVFVILSWNKKRKST